MPWVVRDAVRDINRMVGRRWQAIDPLLPDPAALPAGSSPLPAGRRVAVAAPPRQSREPAGEPIAHSHIA